MRRLLALSFTTLAAALFVSAAALTVHAADVAPAAGTATVTGKVMNKEGKPVESASVKLFAAPIMKKLAEGGAAPKTALKETTTDKDGAFKFENLAAGDYVIRASNKELGGMAKVSVKAGDTTVDAGTITLAPKAAAPAKNPAKGDAKK